MFKLKFAVNDKFYQDVYKDSSDEIKRIVKRDFSNVERKKFHRQGDKNILLYKAPTGYCSYVFFEKNNGNVELKFHTVTPSGKERFSDKVPLWSFPLRELNSEYPTVSEREAFFSKIIEYLDGKSLSDIQFGHLDDIFYKH